MVGGSITRGFLRRPQAVDNSPLPASGPRLSSENTYSGLQSPIWTATEPSNKFFNRLTPSGHIGEEGFERRALMMV